MFYFNLAYLIFTIIALLVIGVNIKEHGKSLVGNLLIYSFFGTLFLGAIRLFFALTDAGLIKIDDGTVMVCWHLMFYLTMLTFLISIRALVKIVDLSHTNSLGNPFIPSIILGLLILAVFAIAAPVDQYVKTYFVDTIWDRSGLVHFVAFAFAGFLSYYLYKINKKFEGNIGALSMPLLVSISLLSIIHLWELLTESWRVIKVEERFGETVEMVIWIPVFLFIIYAFVKLRKALRVNIL